MGFFRRFKLQDYTAEQCRSQCHMIRTKLASGKTLYMAPEVIDDLLVEWACYRELLARHEGKNESSLDD